MYIQITTKCNMACAHCCYSCGPDGIHMSMTVYKKAIKWCFDEGDIIFIGGGEPTLHPRFWEMIGLALRYNNSEMDVGVITNGSRTEDALALARMAKRGVLYAGLSLDQYHEGIDDSVIEAFEKPERKYEFSGSRMPDSDLRDVRRREVGASVAAVGRAKSFGEKRCPCSDILVDPTGKIFKCGCLDTQWGTIFDPKLPENWHDLSSECEGPKISENPRKICSLMGGFR